MADANFKNLNSMNDSGTNGNPIGKDGITTLHQTGSLLNDVQMQEALLEEFYPKLTAYKFGQKAVLKDNGGTQVAWLGFEKLDTTNAKVTVEGKAPDPKKLVPYEITGTVEQYVLGVTFTDRLLKRGKVKCQAVAIDRISKGAAKVTDDKIVGVLTGNDVPKIFGGGLKKAALTKTAYPTEADFEKAYLYLATKEGETYDGYFICLIDSFMASEVRKFQSFVDKSKYADNKLLDKNEIGTLKGFRFIETNNIPTVEVTGASSTQVTCHQAIMFGYDAYGVVDVEGESAGKPRIIQKGLGSAGTKDMADQEASVAAKWEFTAKILCKDDMSDCRVINLLAPVTVGTVETETLS